MLQHRRRLAARLPFASHPASRYGATVLDLVAWHKQLNPAGESTVVFRDSAFGHDVGKTNLAAILNQYGLQNVRSL